MLFLIAQPTGVDNNRGDMHTNLPISTWLLRINNRLIITVCIVIFLFCCSKGKENNNLSHTDAPYELVLKKYDSYKWQNIKDPHEIMDYCDALIESGNNLPSALKSPKLPFYIREFAEAYYALSSGELREAYSRFVNLSKTTEGRIWGNIGILEYSLVTGSIDFMPLPLENLHELSERDSSYVPSWVLPYYEGWYNYNIGNYNKVDEILKNNNDNLDPKEEFILKGYLLIKDDKFEELTEIMSKLPPRIRDDDEVIILESELIYLRDGPDKNNQYLDIKRKEHPESFLINRHFADSLIETGKSKEGMSILNEFARRRPFDIVFQAEMIGYTLEYGDSDEANAAIKKILTNLNYLQLRDFHLLSALICHRGYMCDKTLEHLENVKKLHSKYLPMLLLDFKMAKDNHRYEDAYRLMKNISDMHPNEIRPLLYYAELCCLMGKFNELSDLIRKLDESKRFIDDKTKDKIMVLKKRAQKGGCRK